MSEAGPGSTVDGVAAHPQHLFVVRVWWEPDGEGESGEWRGSIEHIASREKRYFRELKSLSQFIEAHLGQVAFVPEQCDDALSSEE